MRHALNTLATVAPEWLLEHSQPDWLDRYKHGCEDARFSAGLEDHRRFAEQMGRDGCHLLLAVYDREAQAWLRELPAVQILQRGWMQHYYHEADVLRWRTEAEGIPPAHTFVSFPYDVEARYAKTRSTSWVGYKVHLTERCDDDGPHLISHVITTPAPAADGEVTPPVHGRSTRRTCCRTSTWPTRPMWLPSYWCEAETNMGST